MVKIKICPTCGSHKIRQVRRDVTGKFHGESYTARGIVFYECPECKEKVYDRQAIRKIEAASPAFAKAHA